MRPTVYYPILGVFLCLIYLMSLVLIKEITIENKYQRPFIRFDKYGIFIFIGVAVVLLITIFVVFMIYHSYKASSIIFSVFLLINFVIVVIIAKIATKE